MKDRDFTTQLPGSEIFDPEEEAAIQLEVERIAAEFPRYSLADIRKGLGVSQAELAIRMETTTEKIAEIENKGIDVSVWDLYYLLDGLGCDLEIHAKRSGKKMRLRFGPGPQANCA